MNEKHEANSSVYLVHPSRFNIVPWWILSGSAIAGNVILVGEFSPDELDALNNICKQVMHLDIAALEKQDLDVILDAKWPIDVVIIKFLSRLNPAKIHAPSGQIYRLLKKAGAILLLERNSLHIKCIFKRPFAVLRYVFEDSRERQLRRLFHDREISKLETLAYGSQPHEAFPGNTYFTNKNTFLRIEKFKRLLLNSRFSRLFYKAQIWTISPRKNLLIDTLISDLGSNPSFEWESERIRLLKVIFGNKKIIVSLTSKNRDKPEYIVVIPMFQTQYEQRINEKEIIKKLNDSSILSGFFVDRIIEGDAGLVHFFAMQEMEGITIDRAHARVNELTAGAAEVITQMATCLKPEGRTDTLGKPEKIAKSYTDLLLERYPFHEKIIRKIQTNLYKLKTLPEVDFMHGDTKLENFVVDSGMREVIGVIDLELSRIPGLPLIDLFYLISYNRYILFDESFYQAFARLARNDLSRMEKKFISDYCNRLGLNDEQKNSCLILFFLHHYSMRFMFDKSDCGISRDFLSGCDISLTLLESNK